MNIELEFIKFRAKQCIRIVKDIGWVNLLIISPMALIFTLTVIEKLQNQLNSYFAILAYILVVIITHGSRNDGKFLKKIEVSRLKLYVIEYFLMCLPISVIFCLIGHWWAVVMGNLIILLLSVIFLKYGVKSSVSFKKWQLAIIPDTLFEWKSSMRLYNYKLILLWLFGAITAINIYAYFFFVFLFITIVSATFKPTEGKEFRPNNVKELVAKIKHNNFILMLFLTPHVVIFLLFNISFWYIILGIALYFILYQTYCILYKYSTYSQYKNYSNQVPTAIFMILCPILPISIPFIIFSFFKARNRIKYA